ncbi:hypothetical protein F5Y03DRAFT_388333 [Xylaria venustula]|nr:hypothetical protein F5Y03DRAFT_388333 [Xylaria venustula]
MEALDLDQIERIRGQLAGLEAPEAPPSLTSEELQYFWDRGNKRRPLPPNRADNTKVNIIDGTRRWSAFCEALPGAPAWKPLVKTLSWDNRGLAEAFARYLMRREKSRIGALSTIRLYLRQLSAIYRKYTGEHLESRLRDHFVAVAKLEHARLFGLRQEPKHKKVLDPSGFTYLAHFRWVRDRKTAFKIGLDRLDDSLIRDFLMWTGCRRHELVYAQPKNKKKKIKEYDEKSDAYTDVDEPDPYILPRPKECWVCGSVDERTESQYKVLCWENIDLWILHDPMRNGSRDYLAMQVLLRFHKGHNKEIVPTWFPFVEEKLPLLCPISKLLAKAISEGVVGLSGYDACAEPYFNTKISMPAVHIPWKREFWHKPVFRRTVESVEGPIKSDEPLGAKSFDNNSENLGKAEGFPDRFQSYVYRRENLEILDTRHRPNSAVYQRHYANAMRNAMSQDAGLGRGTESPYLDILNHLSIQYDENAPMGVFDEEMRIIGPDSTIRQLEREWLALKTELLTKYRKSTKATGTDRKMREQRRRRKAADLLRKDHFKKRNNIELDRQLRGIYEPQQPLQKVIFSLPERRVLAEIFGDLDEDLPEIEIVQRKVDAINAWIDYAWMIEPKEPAPNQGLLRMPLTDITKQVEAPQAVLELPMHDRTIAPKPRYVSMIQKPVSPAAPMRPDTVMFQNPPPPYSEVDTARPSGATILGGSGTDTLSAARKPTPNPYKCFFCGRRFTRKGNRWNCEERHLKRRFTEAVPCPDPGCKPKGIVLENELRFKNYAKFIYDYDMRPTVTTEARCDHLEDHPERARDSPLTYPHGALENLGHFEAAVGSEESFKPFQDHSTYPELEENPWISPIFMPADTFMEDCSLVTTTASPTMLVGDLAVSEYPSLNSSLSDLTDPDTCWSPLQPCDAFIDPLIDTSVPVAMESSESSAWEDVGTPLQPALTHGTLLGPASPESLAQVNHPPMLYSLPSTIPTEYIDPAIREESPDSCARSLVAVDTVEINAATSEPDEIQRVPDYIVNGEEFWNVERLLDRRLRRKSRKGRPAVEYLVRWENHGPENDTWEPRKSLKQDVPDMVREFDTAYLSRNFAADKVSPRV